MTTAQAELEAEIVSRLAELLPGADRPALAARVTELGLKPHGARSLRDHVTGHDDALTSGDSSAPATHLRLLRALRTDFPEVQAARCERCGQVRELLHRGNYGRVCRVCYRDARLETCSRCQRPGPVATRDQAGPVCDQCRRADTSTWLDCSQCGRLRRVCYRVGGKPFCQSCGPRPLRTCADCGRHKPAHANTDAGPLCVRCYRQANRRACEVCGLMTVTRRRNPDGTRTCERCWTPPVVECCECGQVKPCYRGAASGRPTCQSCRGKARKRRECVRCRRPRQLIHTRLPMGEVCGPCYTKIRRWPGQCASCGQRRPLVGTNDQYRLICGPCAGDDRNWICQGCGNFAALFSDGRCPRCLARDRLDALLAGPDQTPRPQLAALRQLLDAELDTDPFTIIFWLSRAKWGQLLGRLASQHEKITHEVLDAQPPGRHVGYLRAVLVNAEILPARAEDVESTPVWLEGLLAGLPAAISQVIRPYAMWSVLRRARTRARHRPPTRSVRKHIRTRITIAVTFLNWLAAHRLTLETVTQADVDLWLEGGSNAHYRLREFLAWAAARGLTSSRLEVPWLGRGELQEILDADQRWALLRRCLTDEQLDMPVRVAGALVLLYGQVPTRLTQLTTSDITISGTRTYLTFDGQPVLLPPRLAGLLTTLARTASAGRRPLIERLDQDHRYLFPGARPGLAISRDRLSELLNPQLGLRVRPARNAALCALAADLPAPVLADLLGLHITTAVRWARLVRRDWTDYLAARKTATNQNVRPRPYPPTT